ncbi:MAG TPA: bacterial transcriptional activator domain-containing protein, partial [Methylibium sp.]|nr:bacterial transcriptional activator domain-containing protein [Methylibium sp.]
MVKQELPVHDAGVSAPARIALRLLHAPRLELTGGAAWPLPPKDAALLALLAIDGPTARARIAALLWPAADPDGAHNNLRQRLFRLRRAAGRDVVLAGPTLALAPGVVHDLAELRNALVADPGALAGELLGACDHDDTIELAQWASNAREQWRTRRRDALAAIAIEHERADRVAAALPYAERLVREEPLAEHAARLLMRLHYRRGDRSAALAAYERLRAALDEQLGETPAGETQQLAALIEASLALPVAVPSATPVAVLRPPRL